MERGCSGVTALFRVIGWQAHRWLAHCEALAMPYPAHALVAVAAQMALAGVLAATLLALLWLAYIYVLPLLSGAAGRGGRARTVQDL